MGRWARGALLAVAALAALAAWGQWRILAPVDPAALPSASFDAYAYYHPTLRYAFGELRAGRLPLWNPHQHAGSPFLATAQHVLLYPLNLPYLLLDPASAETASAFIHLALAGAGTVWLARTLALAWPAALVAGLAFVLAPPVTALVFLPHHLYAIAWLPAALALAHRVCAAPRRWRWTALLGAVAALQYLGGYPQFVVMSAYAIAGYVAWRLWPAWRDAAGRRHLAHAVLACAAAALLAASLAAPQLLPSLELARLSVRAEPLSLAAAAINSGQPLGSLLRAVLPMHAEAAGSFTTLTPSVGVPALLLALLALLATPRRPGTGFFLALTAVAWTLALGTNAPLFALYHALPGGDAFRIPLRFAPLAALGLAMLAGYGTDALAAGRLPARRAARAAGVLVVTGLAALAVARWVPLPAPAYPAQGGVGFTLPALPVGVALAPAVAALGVTLIAAAAWLALYRWAGARGRARLVWTLPPVVYAVLCVAVINRAPLPASHPELHTMPEAVASYLRGAQGIARTYVVPSGWPFTPPGRYLPARAGILHGLYVAGDRENVYVARFADYAERLLPAAQREGRETLARRLGLPPYLPQGELIATADGPNLRLLDLLGVRFIAEGPASDFRQTSAAQRFPEVFAADGVRVYENVAALPRAFLVQRVEVVPEPAHILARLTAPEFDPRTTAIVERDPGLPAAPPAAGAAGTAEVVRYDAEHVVIAVDAPAPSLLVLTDQAYPGWQARIGDQPAEILVTDYLFRGVVVPAGRQHVTLTFVPSSFQLGIALGLGGLALFSALALATRRRRA